MLCLKVAITLTFTVIAAQTKYLLVELEDEPMVVPTDEPDLPHIFTPPPAIGPMPAGRSGGKTLFSIYK